MQASSPRPKSVEQIAQEAREEELENSGETSPLLEVSPEAMSELIGRLQDNLIKGMPREVAEPDLRRIVEYQKAKRREFRQEEALLASKPTRKKRTPEEIEADKKAKAADKKAKVQTKAGRYTLEEIDNLMEL